METQSQINFNRIAEAIEYLRLHFREQPDLELLAGKVHLSPFHFQRLFTEWAGVSPKKFLQYLTINYAKGLLKQQGATLFDTALEAGLSGTGRLHDLFISIESMTPAEYRDGGSMLSIRYSFTESLFGRLLIASTSRGICYICFADEEQEALGELRKSFPRAQFEEATDAHHQQATKFFKQEWEQPEKLKLHLKGTPFQLKVWEALLKIPLGSLSTYGNIAHQIQQPAACRAVGTAIGQNPIAFLIPCHRVIQSSGNIGHYHWGSTRKHAMIGWEAARMHQN